jgi:DNA mismatch repair protein MutS
VAVREWHDDIVFLHRVVPGGTDRSYGIQVARLAGLPADVIARARALMMEFEQGTPVPAPPEGSDAGQLALFGGGGATAGQAGTAPPSPPPVLTALASLDPDRLTPLEALATLYALKRQAAEDP